jgi:hypothetical protein
MSINNKQYEGDLKLESLTDDELLELCEELQMDSHVENGIVRKLAIQFFGGQAITQMIMVNSIVLPFVAKRLKVYVEYHKLI